MVSLRDLESHIDPHRLREVLQRYVRARRLRKALEIVEAERHPDDGRPPAAMAAANETIEGCIDVLAPAIVLAEGAAVTAKEVRLRTVTTDPHSPASRAALLRWLAVRRGPNATPLDIVLDQLAEQLGLSTELVRD